MNLSAGQEERCRLVGSFLYRQLTAIRLQEKLHLIFFCKQVREKLGQVNSKNGSLPAIYSLLLSDKLF